MKVVNVVCHGDENYLHSLGFSKANTVSGETDGPVYQHDVTYERSFYTLCISHSQQKHRVRSIPDISVFFIDSTETLFESLESDYIFTLPTLFVWIKNEGVESNPVLQEFIRGVEKQACLELTIDQLKNCKDKNLLRFYLVYFKPVF